MKRTLLIITVGLLVVAAVGFGAWKILGKSELHKTANSTDAETTATTPTPAAETKPKRIRLIASGDELPHDTVNDHAKTADGYDFTQFFSEIKPIFDAADIRFCNQEVPSGGLAVGAITGYPTFNAPTEFARDLSKVGCNLINTATNHTNDKHQAGIDATQAEWEKLPKLAIAGANRSPEEQAKVRYFTVKDVKFAFLAYNQINNDKNVTSYGVNMFDENLISQQLAEARQQAQIVLVSMHWGTEYSSGIDSQQDKWSRFLADRGADVVLGTGPHVLEPAKKLPKAGGGETLVWYSLGNMLSTQLDIESLVGGFAVMDFKLDGEKATLDNIGFLPTYMHYEWTPAQKSAENLRSRTNLKLYLLENAASPLARSQNNTTVAAQQNRVKEILNSYLSVPMLSSGEYLR